jgi:uncharacterized membrane protein
MKLLRTRLIVIAIVVVCLGALRYLLQPSLVMGAISEMRQAISQTISDPIEDPDWDVTDQVQSAAQSVIMDRSEHLFRFNLVLDGAILLMVIVSMLPGLPVKLAPDPTTHHED